MKSDIDKFKFLEIFLIDIIEKKKLYDKYFLSWILLKNGKNDFSFSIQEQIGNFYLKYEDKTFPLILDNICCSFSFLNNNKELLELLLKSLKTNQMSSTLEIKLPFYGKYKLRYFTSLNYTQNSTINFRSLLATPDYENFYEILLFVLENYLDSKSFSKEEIKLFNEEYYKLTNECVDFSQDLKKYIYFLEERMKINRIFNY